MSTAFTDDWRRTCTSHGRPTAGCSTMSARLMSILVRVGVGVVAAVLAASARRRAHRLPRPQRPGCGAGLGPDGTPLLLGSSRLTAEQLIGWWNQTGQVSANTTAGTTPTHLYADGAAPSASAPIWPSPRPRLRPPSASTSRPARAATTTTPASPSPTATAPASASPPPPTASPPTSPSCASSPTPGSTTHPSTPHSPAASPPSGRSPVPGPPTPPTRPAPRHRRHHARPPPGPPDSPASGTGAAPTAGPVALATTDGITVAATMAPQLHALITVAAAARLRLTGGGYRDASQQIALRRAHCGPTPYDISRQALQPMEPRRPMNRARPPAPAPAHGPAPPHPHRTPP